ncbi:MAG: sulfurtransferase TusA family protein [Dermatophilaceae bacterium]|nr:sulfurtransferase TusA family protein [Dermatophilaceae bacterium]
MSPAARPDPGVPPVEVDARGLRCPLPVIRLAEAARDAAAGAVMVVLAGDPAARHDIAAWCRMRDHELQDVTEIREATGAGAGPAYLRFVVLIRHSRDSSS